VHEFLCLDPFGSSGTDAVYGLWARRVFLLLQEALVLPDLPNCGSASN